MTASVIIAITLGWLFGNMWLTLIMLKLNKSFISEWNELAWLLLASVISPITIYFVGIVAYKIRRKKK